MTNHPIAVFAAAVMLVFAIQLDQPRAQGLQWSPMAVQATANLTNSQEKKPKKEKKEKKEKAVKSGGVTFHEGSGETRAERDKRLTRECRGRPNAGLCEGYARP